PGLRRAPTVLPIDEPSLGLSPPLIKENFNIIRSINERGITVLLVEQNVHQTLAISHYGFVLSKGRVAARGTPTELAARQDVRDAYFGCPMTSSVELTQDLVRCRTINPPGDERACAERLASLLEGAGFAV